MLKTNNTTAAWLSGPIEEGEALRRLSETATPSLAPPRRGRHRSAFHIGMAVAFLVTAFAGFAPSYLPGAHSERLPISPLFHVHGMVFSGWLVLLLVQSLLVAKGSVRLHRRLGMAGAALAVLMVPLGIATAIKAAGRPIGTSGQDPAALLVFQIGAVILFAGFVIAAIWKRKKPESHRRLILLATICIMPPAIARLPLVDLRPVLAGTLSLLFVVAGILHDYRVRGRVHRVYLLGGLILALSGPVRFGIGQTAAWQSFAEQLTATEITGADGQHEQP